TTLAVEAGRSLIGAGGDPGPDALWFTTATPAYADKTNATAVHAALRLDTSTAALDLGGAIRSGIGALRAALEGAGTTLLVASDVRTGPPGSPAESGGADAGAALLVGDGTEADLSARYLGGASVTDEVFDHWREPGSPHPRAWEERFAESIYPDLGREAWEAALKVADLTAEQVDRVAVIGTHARSAAKLTRSLGLADGVAADDLTATVGNPGAAQAGLVLTSLLETTEPGQVLALVSLADGADVLVLRVAEGATAR
ncbi:MAG: hydroxymethylglutaryl-CoA synthase, partial [Actinomycetota bacterium]